MLNGNTPMHEAAFQGDAETVQCMIDDGQNIEVRNNEGKTPLHSAAYFGQKKTVETLIKAGSDVNVRDINGDTPLHIVAKYGKTEVQSGGIDPKTRRLYVAQVVKILIKANSEIYSRNRKGWTPLHVAAAYGTPETVREYVNEGADLTIQTSDGEFAVSLAEENPIVRNDSVFWKLHDACYGKEIMWDQKAAKNTGIIVKLTKKQNCLIIISIAVMIIGMIATISLQLWK